MKQVLKLIAHNQEKNEIMFKKSIYTMNMKLNEQDMIMKFFSLVYTCYLFLKFIQQLFSRLQLVSIKYLFKILIF
jgi:hypothetical protein